jgi:GxxExxY protein
MNGTFRSREPFGEEGFRLVGAAMEVFNVQGHGLTEPIYQECLEIELRLREIPFEAQRELTTFYKGQALRKKYIPDIVVFGSILVELKAVKALDAEHESQLLNYMHLTKTAVGYLINFGQRDALEWKRYLLSQYL